MPFMPFRWGYVAEEQAVHSVGDGCVADQGEEGIEDDDAGDREGDVELYVKGH